MVNLRSQAELKIPALLKKPLDTSLEINVTLEQLRELVQELAVHKIELELQNEELQRNLKELKKAKDKLADMFELAPVGYLILSPTGHILQLNETSAALLCQAKSQLVGRSIYQIFADQHSGDLFRYLHSVFKDQTQKSFTAEILREDASRFSAKLDSVIHLNEVGSSTAQCLMLISDVSKPAAKTAAELLERDKSHFLVANHHEHRQPLHFP